MSDGFMKAAIGVAALSVGYYYALYLPGRDAEAKAAAEQSILNEQAASASKAAADERNAAQRRIAFSECKSNAFAEYSTRWDATCAKLNTEEQKALNSCARNGYDRPYCEQAFPVRPAENCHLPRQTADDYDKAHEADQQLCLATAKEGLAL